MGRFLFSLCVICGFAVPLQAANTERQFGDWLAECTETTYKNCTVTAQTSVGPIRLKREGRERPVHMVFELQLPVLKDDAQRYLMHIVPSAGHEALYEFDFTAHATPAGYAEINVASASEPFQNVLIDHMAAGQRMQIMRAKDNQQVVDTALSGLAEALAFIDAQQNAIGAPRLILPISHTRFTEQSDVPDPVLQAWKTSHDCAIRTPNLDDIFSDNYRLEERSDGQHYRINDALSMHMFLCREEGINLYKIIYLFDARTNDVQVLKLPTLGKSASIVGLGLFFPDIGIITGYKYLNQEATCGARYIWQIANLAPETLSDIHFDLIESQGWEECNTPRDLTYWPYLYLAGRDGLTALNDWIEGQYEAKKE